MGPQCLSNELKVSARALTLGVVLAIGAGACAWLGLGGGTGLNDAVPTGTLVSQGSFSYGGAATGTAQIYSITTGDYVVRLSNLSITSTESGLQLRVSANSGVVAIFSLRGYTGNQDYEFTLSGAAAWTDVSVHSNASNSDIAIAPLSSTTGNCGGNPC